MKRIKYEFLVKYLSLSALVHFLILIGINVFEGLPSVIGTQPISIEVIEPPLPTTSTISKKQARLENQHVVEQEEKQVNDEAPEKTRYLSRNNQTVKKQTVAKNKGEFQNLASKAQPPPGRRGTKNLKDLLLPLDPFALMQKQVEKENAQRLEKELALREREIRNAQPNFGQNFDQDQKQNIGNASQSPDYLKDIDLGLETMLSTKEFKYYTYFNRIRRQLSQYWEPKVRDKLHKMFRQGRTIASNEDKITKLVIFLNPTGQLVKVQVMSESGIKDLDEAAIDAFRAAAPFPNPPQGIVDPDGFVKIRWDFVLEV
ncbi:MAG: TonB family protein [Bdellovibrionaceae bacterium]|nr:TonB family protein [Pseudobdellovibrionaceae bacterium]